MINFEWILSSVIIIIFGTISMTILADVNFFNLPRKKQIISATYFVTYLTLNVLIHMFLGSELYGDLYLLFTQIPLYILLFIITRYRGIRLIFLYLSITIFSSTAMFLSSFIIYFTKTPIWGVLPSYALLVWVSYRFLKEPFFHILEYADNKLIGWLSILPILHYLYNYYTTKYQYFTIVTVINRDFWARGLTLAIVLFSYCMIIVFFKIIQKKSSSDAVQEMISQQLHDATQQLEQLRLAEKQAALYRHDMRHHFNYINSCISQNKLEDATEYIQQLCTVFDESRIISYSSNESLNLVFSSFQKEAAENQITFTVDAPAKDFSRFALIDLCKLLYNGLENAIRACLFVEDVEKRHIHIELYEKNQKLCCEIRNSYALEPHFNENGIPLSNRNNHGIGVKSMVYVVNKYHGVYKFSVTDNEFCFQMCM